MDKTTTWIIRIMSLVVLAAIGAGFYIFNENNKRAKKLEAESYCKNDYLYRLYKHCFTSNSVRENAK